MPEALPRPATPSGLQAILRRFGLRPRRALSQHFLVDPRQASRIADALGAAADDAVLEIGAGLGALTLPLAERAGRVLAVERDPALAAALAQVLQAHGLRREEPGGPSGTVQLVVADALRLPLADLASLVRGQGPGGRCLVAGNLPYGITSPLLMWLAQAAGWARAVIMVQKEVADRLAARPGTPAYGSLTVAVQARCSVRPLFQVSRRCFFPVPEVDSTVLLLEPLPGRPGPQLGACLEAVLRAAFGQRRKTLRNALRSLSPDPGAVDALLRSAGVDGDLRGEALDVGAFLRLAAAWEALAGPRRSGPAVL